MALGALLALALGAPSSAQGFHHFAGRAPRMAAPRMFPPARGGGWGRPAPVRPSPWGRQPAFGGPVARDYAPPVRGYRQAVVPPGNGYWMGGRWYYGPPPAAYAAPPQAVVRSWRRGGYLPPDYQGSIVQDFGRFHLRRPPFGYNWVQAGNQYLLVSSSTGLIFDVAPGY